MRRITRASLPLPTRVDLRSRTRKIPSPTDAIRKEWENYRKSKPARPVVSALKLMAGPRERCAFCGDSLASDIDHFVPIALSPELTYTWYNMLWICTPCNRKKGNRFPISPEGVHLLINPERDDPWDDLIIDADTGVLAPRYLEAGFSKRGEETLRVLETINYEGVIEGRRRTLDAFKVAAGSVVINGGEDGRMQALFRLVREDTYGVAAWMVLREGANSPPFTQVQASYPNEWRRLCNVARLR